MNKNSILYLMAIFIPFIGLCIYGLISSISRQAFTASALIWIVYVGIVSVAIKTYQVIKRKLKIQSENVVTANFHDYFICLPFWKRPKVVRVWAIILCGLLFVPLFSFAFRFAHSSFSNGTTSLNYAIVRYNIFIVCIAGIPLVFVFHLIRHWISNHAINCLKRSNSIIDENYFKTAREIYLTKSDIGFINLIISISSISVLVLIFLLYVKEKFLT